MAADPIRFTLIEDGQDVRPFDFSTDKIQIGCDASRGDNLLIELPDGRRHVRARVIRGDDYVEFEVVGGPVWLQGSRMDEGDVAELNVGDILVFGTKKAGGSTLRFEYSREAEIVMDDVADWSVAATPKKKRGQNAEDDMLFDEEVDPTAGMNPWEKARYKYRQQYKKFAAFRKKAARVKYWISLGQLIWSKVGKTFVMFGGFAALGFGWYGELQGRLQAEETTETAEKNELLGTQTEAAALEMSTELQEEMRMCGCDSAQGANEGVVAASEAILANFADETLVPERPYPMPEGKSQSMASIISPSLANAKKARPHIDAALERVCSARGGGKDKMNKVQEELSRHGLHEAYGFIPFGRSLWCELAISSTSSRGMLQLTRPTALRAFGEFDSDQAQIPSADLADHREWLKTAAKKYNGYSRMLGKCPITVATAYREQFYGGETNADHPNRLDPGDARTDWEASVDAAYGWLKELDEMYADKGFREADRVLLTLTAYNQGEDEVQRWIDGAKAIYKVEADGALTFPQIFGGGIKRLREVSKDAEAAAGVKAGLAYAPRIVGRYLYTKPRLPEGCLE